MKKRFNIYHRGVLRTMAKIDDFLLDHTWTLFQSLEDCYDPHTVEAVIYMHRLYDFDLDVLPERLYDAVVAELRQDALESYADSRSEELIDERRMHTM